MTNEKIGEADDEGLDQYGNPLDGSALPNCCFPDCGCNGARLCAAKSGPSDAALGLNFELGYFGLKPWEQKS